MYRGKWKQPFSNSDSESNLQELHMGHILHSVNTLLILRITIVMGKEEQKGVKYNSGLK
jgi:hypothetical protein